MILKLNKVSKSFDGKVVLNEFSFTFEEKGLYFVVGSSGIGKTTLLRIIAGLDKEYSGEIENGNIKNTSFMFQEYRLFPAINALKNATISSSDDSAPMASDLLMRLGFTEDDLHKRPRELSGGMKQRVAFVRAVLKNSPILILDEPTKELDPDIANVMLEIIKEEAKTRLVIVVSHDNLYSQADDSHVIML